MQDRKKSQQVDQEIAIVARVVLPDDPVEMNPLEEIEGLAETAGAIVMSGMVQRREKPDNSTFLGRGKVEELKNLVEFHAADVVLFDNDLSPGQNRNLEKALNVKVLDRTEVILDIFATHAQTYESRLAVELAQLEYSLPRLKRMWTHLSRLKMGVGMRGPGEKQLETDRRLVEKRIHDLKLELKKVELRKERQVASRKGTMTVSLVGYTNAGKSTLMNSLTTAEVLAEDKLFATLDTRTRRLTLPSWGPILLSDTVGFIRNLPHSLIASFKATLEETRQADLLLHVADVSNPKVNDQIRAVYDVLKELDIEEKDTLLVLNKADQVTQPGVIEKILLRYPQAVAVSAKTKENFANLHRVVSEALSRSFKDVDIEMPVGNGKLLAFLADKGEIKSSRFGEDAVRVHCRIPQKYLGRIVGDSVVVSPHSPAGWTDDELIQNSDQSVSNELVSTDKQVSSDLDLNLHSESDSIAEIESNVEVENLEDNSNAEDHHQTVFIDPVVSTSEIPLDDPTAS
ncbi:MAG: GTPase HflX [Planctomycetota bacterium]